MPLLYPGDAAHVPGFMPPEAAAAFGPVVEQAHYGAHLRAALVDADGWHAEHVDPIALERLHAVRRRASAVLNLTGTVPPRITTTFQSGPLRRFAWHRDNTNDVKLLINVGEAETRALLAPTEQPKGDAWLGYDPTKDDIQELILRPGDAYALDNRTSSIAQMAHATPNQEGRKMLVIEYTPPHKLPLGVGESVNVIRGLRQG